MDDYTMDALRGAVPFYKLSAKEFGEVLPLLSHRLAVYMPGQYFAHSGEPADYMGILMSGEAVATHTTFSGSVYTLREYSVGDLMDIYGFFSSPRSWPLSIMARTECRVLVFSMQGFMEGGSAPDNIKLSVISSVLTSIADLHNKEMIRDISRSAVSVRGKILTFLDLMQDKFGSNVFRLRVGRDGLADLLGVGRSSLFAELAKLKEEGVAVIARDGMVTVHSEKMDVLRGIS